MMSPDLLNTHRNQLNDLLKALKNLYQRCLDADADADADHLVSVGSAFGLGNAIQAVARELTALPPGAPASDDGSMSSTQRLRESAWSVYKLMGPDNDDDGDADIAALKQLSHDAQLIGVKAADLQRAGVLSAASREQIDYAASSLANDLEDCLASNNR